MSDLYAKSLEESNLHRERELLMKKHHEGTERQELIDSYRREADEYTTLL